MNLKKKTNSFVKSEIPYNFKKEMPLKNEFWFKVQKPITSLFTHFTSLTSQSDNEDCAEEWDLEVVKNASSKSRLQLGIAVA